jgi:uncharacterized protein YbjQ (UPF0145 family)
MTRKPGVGKTQHKWLLGDLDAALADAQQTIGRLLAELLANQERPGKRLADLAMLVAELAQIISRARAIAAAMQELIQQAPDADADALAELRQRVTAIEQQLKGDRA